ncbi:DUF4649 family protein [Streptococcus mutans]|nr:DUF4649 family protein [Streptococcus mutans]
MMIVLTYLDAHQTKKKASFNSIEEFMLSLSGCVTLPDSYQVLSLTYKGKDIGYRGLFGDLYRKVYQMDWSSV